MMIFYRGGEKMKVKKITIAVLVVLMAVGTFTALGIVNHVHALDLTLVNEKGDYERVDIEVDESATGLEVKEALASTLNDGIAPEDLCLLYTTAELEKDQLYDADSVNDVANDGDTLFYVVSPIANGSVYEEDNNFFFECIAYDQNTGQWYYALTPVEDPIVVPPPEQPAPEE